MQNTEIVRIKQRAIRLVTVERVLSVEVPVGLRDKSRIESLIGNGERDYGPFPYKPVRGSEHLEATDVCFLGGADGPADMPLRMEVGI